ncbi:hypothetical protein ONE63_003846 [Megalurothrips usitatus]|uniref:Uncharacterized protein n=1 Tax=Megalurothrips usitatus TaxID=439358 RepID=A0AAV7X527_9NEOP|nr:hypothetical protein ONE63_003846 [Megalurothrips usitatus]
MSDSGDSPPVLPGRRRSSLVPRKSIAPASVSNILEVALRQYVTEAKHETEEWTNLCKQRHYDKKSSEAVLQEALSDPPTLTLEMIKEGLDDKYLEFIQNTPDYAKFSSDVRTFAETVSVLKTRMLNVQSLREGHDLLAKAHLDALAKSVCEYNDEAPAWHKGL